jgi:hypothetical protein
MAHIAHKHGDSGANLMPVIVAACIAVLLVAIAGIAFLLIAIHARTAGKSSRTEQLAVYRAALRERISMGTYPVKLQPRVFPLDKSELGDSNCKAGLDLEPTSEGGDRRFQYEELAQLGSSRIQLLEPDALEKATEGKDTPESIRGGTPSWSDALQKAFGGAVLTLSEIRFDKAHTHAIVSYNYSCPGECSNGATALIEKRNGDWRRLMVCAGWVI